MPTLARAPRKRTAPSSETAVAAGAEALRQDAPTFTITELAQEFDITPRAIRFYEDVGLLEPARSGRNRVYTHRDRTRLKLTLRGKRLGLSLLEVKQLVDMYESGTDARPQLEAFLEVLDNHRRQLEQQLDDITVTLAEIEQHAARCRSLLAGVGKGTAKAAAKTTKTAAPRKSASRKV
jgi:DNA-binding transcriptional MerR regulator